MSRDNPLMLSEPYFTFLANFWHCLLDDLHMRGCTSDSLPVVERRGLPYQERVIIEREILQREAREFLETSEFRSWARASDFDPDTFKESLLHGNY